MSTTVEASAEPGAKAATGAHNGAERRKRRRAKISAQVHVSTAGTSKPFEEVSMTVDVSRDGLLFTSDHSDYFKGQTLDVTFPYSRTQTAMEKPQRADIVRVIKHTDGKYGVAVQFHAASPGARVEDTSGTGYSRNNPLEPVQSGRGGESMVLAVEPDAHTGATLRNMLEHDGYKVVIVATAEEALSILRTTVPAAFIAEVEGSDMSGQDLCLIIKRNERLQRVPVILLTRSAQPADYSASHQMGAVICMAKPFKPERLQHVIRLVAPPPVVKSAYSGSRSMGGLTRNL
jgi:CheY-like chemotaxis protein